MRYQSTHFLIQFYYLQQISTSFIDTFSSSQNCQSNLSCSCLSWQSYGPPGPCLLLFLVLLKDQLDQHCNAVHYYPPLHLGKQKEREEERKELKIWHSTNPISINERILDTDLWYLVNLCHPFRSSLSSSINKHFQCNPFLWTVSVLSIDYTLVHGYC